jgi:hypothetical protein
VQKLEDGGPFFPKATTVLLSDMVKYFHAGFQNYCHKLLPALIPYPTVSLHPSLMSLVLLVPCFPPRLAALILLAFSQSMVACASAGTRPFYSLGQPLHISRALSSPQRQLCFLLSGSAVVCVPQAKAAIHHLKFQALTSPIEHFALQCTARSPPPVLGSTL